MYRYKVDLHQSVEVLRFHHVGVAVGDIREEEFEWKDIVAIYIYIYVYIYIYIYTSLDPVHKMHGCEHDLDRLWI